MAITNVSAQVILKTLDNITANFCTNTFHFRLDHSPVSGDPVSPNLEDITNEVNNALVTLYDTVRPRLGGLAQNGHRIKYVDIEGPRPQYPYLETVWNFSSAPDTSQLPSEVCIVSSYEAPQEAGVNQSSRRGRVFLGPITPSASDSTGKVTDAARANIALAFNNFSDDQDNAGATGWQWVVRSQKLGTSAQVAMGHVDNAFDTQRRRGVGSTARSVWGS